MPRHLIFAAVGGLLVAGAGCVPTSSGTGSGGSTVSGSGGSTATGSGGRAATGSGGSVTPGSGGSVTPGSGGSVTTGSGGAPVTVFDCGATATPTNGNVTDFSDWNNTMGKWGVAPGLRGTRYGYSSPSMDGGPPSTNVVMVDATLQNLSFTGSVEPAGYAGAGLGFDVCGNVSGYTGLQFSYSGTLGGCALEIQLVTFSQKPTDQNPAGGCDRTVTSCFNFPKKTMLPEPTATLTPITIPFAEMTGWTAANATEIVGIQWQVTVPPPVDGGQTTCAIDLRFDDIKFVM